MQVVAFTPVHRVGRHLDREGVGVAAVRYADALAWVDAGRNLQRDETAVGRDRYMPFRSMATLQQGHSYGVCGVVHNFCGSQDRWQSPFLSR